MLLKILEFVFVLVGTIAFIHMLEEVVINIACKNDKLFIWFCVHDKIVNSVTAVLLLASIYFSWQIVAIYG